MPRNQRARQAAVPAFTLGWELEATRSASVTPDGVVTERDGSVNGEGREYKIDVSMINRIPESMDALRRLTADSALHVDRSCGFHVHVGLLGRIPALQRQQWAAQFVMLAKAVEELAFMAVPESRRDNPYCRKWSSFTRPITQFRYQASKYSNSEMRYRWVNVVEMFRPGGIGTVEIRLLGCTKRYAYLLGWVGFCRAMGLSAWRMVADPTLLQTETERLLQLLGRVQDRLLRSSDNESAYETAAILADAGNVMLAQDVAELVALAPVTESDRDTRIRNERAAHSLALREWERDEVDRCQTVAIADNIEWEQARVSREVQEALDRARRPRTQQTAPAVTVPNLQGFNPDAFEIVATGGR